MRLADRHATWPVGKTSLHLDPHCDHHHLLQHCYPHIKQHHLGEIEVQRGGSGHLDGLDQVCGGSPRATHSSPLR